MSRRPKGPSGKTPRGRGSAGRGPASRVPPTRGSGKVGISCWHSLPSIPVALSRGLAVAWQTWGVR